MKWSRIDAAGDGPGARSSHAACAVGDALYVYGGERQPRVPVDAALFKLEGGAWTKVPRRGAGGYRGRSLHACLSAPRAVAPHAPQASPPQAPPPPPPPLPPGDRRRRGRRRPGAARRGGDGRGRAQDLPIWGPHGCVGGGRRPGPLVGLRGEALVGFRGEALPRKGAPGCGGSSSTRARAQSPGPAPRARSPRQTIFLLYMRSLE
jgi:hypothetical protein